MLEIPHSLRENVHNNIQKVYKQWPAEAVELRLKNSRRIRRTQDQGAQVSAHRRRRHRRNPEVKRRTRYSTFILDLILPSKASAMVSHRSVRHMLCGALVLRYFICNYKGTRGVLEDSSMSYGL